MIDFAMQNHPGHDPGPRGDKHADYAIEAPDQVRGVREEMSDA